MARERQLVTCEAILIILSADFFPPSRNFASQNGVAQYIQNAERKELPTKNIWQSYPSELKETGFSRQAKVKEFITTQPALQEMLMELP